MNEGPFEWDGTSWSAMERRCNQDDLDDDMSEDNGYILNGTFLPETVLEDILTRIDVKDVLACNQVPKLLLFYIFYSFFLSRNLSILNISNQIIKCMIGV